MTLRFQTRLILFSTVTFAVLLTVLSFVSYRLLARQLDRDATADLIELTNGLHGYLRFERGLPLIAFDEKDADQVAFVHDATRYYQIYDGADGSLLVESQGFEPLGLHFTPDECVDSSTIPERTISRPRTAACESRTARSHPPRADDTCSR
jgi:hypothetical protein